MGPVARRRLRLVLDEPRVVPFLVRVRGVEGPDGAGLELDIGRRRGDVAHELGVGRLPPGERPPRHAPGEGAVEVVARGRDADDLPLRRRHLAGQRLGPDQPVEPAGVGVVDVGLGHLQPRGPDRLVGVLDGAGGHVRPRPLAEVLLAESLLHLGPGLLHRRLRQPRGVGPDVGDVAGLVEHGGQRGGLAGAPPEARARRLEQRVGGEGGVGTTLTGPRLGLRHRHPPGGLQRGDGGLGGVPVERALRVDLAALVAPRVVIVPVVEPDLQVDAVGQRVDLEVRDRDVGLALQLPLHHEPERRRLDPAHGVAPAAQHAVRHLRRPVADQPVEELPDQRALDHVPVDGARVVERTVHRLLGHLVERDPVGGALLLQHPLQRPGDELALTVRVGGDPEGGLGPGFLPPVRPHPRRARQLARAVRPVRLGGVLAVLAPLVRQRLDVPARGQDLPVPAEIRLERPRLRGGLDDQDIARNRSTCSVL